MSVQQLTAILDTALQNEGARIFVDTLALAQKLRKDLYYLRGRLRRRGNDTYDALYMQIAEDVDADGACRPCLRISIGLPYDIRVEAGARHAQPD